MELKINQTILYLSEVVPNTLNLSQPGGHYAIFSYLSASVFLFPCRVQYRLTVSRQPCVHLSAINNKQTEEKNTANTRNGTCFIVSCSIYVRLVYGKSIFWSCCYRNARSKMVSA